jgi:phosphoglycerol transferase
MVDLCPGDSDDAGTPMIKVPPAAAGPGLRIDLVRSVVLAVVVAVIWCVVYHRWTVESWQTPITYLGDMSKSDEFSLFAGIKAAGEGHISPFYSNDVPELGAPYDANWNDFPTTEKPLIILTGWLGRVVGIFAAANFALLMAQVLAAVSFYAAARLLGGAWVWSFGGALVFALARYEFAQGLHHLTITYCWAVPLGLVVAIWMLRGKGIEFGGWRFRFALCVAVITGVQNIYYTNMFAQLVLFGGLLQGWRHGWKACLPALAVIGTGAAAFVVMNLNTIGYGLIHGWNSGSTVRNYQWMEIYGLKLVDLVMPPPDHRFPPFAAWGAAHLKEIVLSPGERPPSAYLGIIGLLAMAWLVLDSLRRLAGRARPPLEAWLILWIVVYAGVGGVNGIIGTLGFDLIRSANRYSIFILCLALMYAVRRLSLRDYPNQRSVYAAALVGIGIALWDQTPPLVSAGDVEETAHAVASDRAFTEKMEERLPAQAMVFQLPEMEYPESPVAGVGSCEHFRPYLFSGHLRFSFGSDKGRAREQWQHGLDRLPLADMIGRLESYGFSALYVNLNAFADKGAALAGALKAIGRGDMFTSDRGDLLCVLLKPSAAPVMPDAD